MAPPLVAEVQRLLLEHLNDHHALYGEFSGVRSARKHIGWYVRGLPGGEAFRSRMNKIEDAAAQSRAVREFFEELGGTGDRMPLAAPMMSDDEKEDARAEA